MVLQAVWFDTDPFGFDCLSNFPLDSGISLVMTYCIRPRQAQSVRQAEFVDQSHSESTFACRAAQVETDTVSEILINVTMDDIVDSTRQSVLI